MLITRLEEFTAKEPFRLGVVIHTNCVTAGHGPGVTTLMTSPDGKIIPQINAKANIASLLNLRAYI